MSTVTLSTVWLNLASDPSVYQSFPLMASLNVATSVPGEVRRLANGRRRTFTLTGKDRAISVSLPHCTREQITWLEDHAGELMCIRDDRGRKVWGTFFEVPVDENQYADEGSLTLAVSEVTHSEAV